ncbi:MULTISPECIES: hypothetical protein [unclassified Cellulophaga]|uniref:hypothetical protein n=1 Tax=unclassified Cellulophaga TaxID=2634405 RepID=UPI0026E33774|nr:MULTISPECIES: hypothetical protein [unclassified Cellulophaga]MDO6491223.1 hypothetical protein [Cellulophaga sp. 2_MG-2023]MDO6495244.1 hypothetical protein [Cellulophaga sp. 3_MG-2023]
MNKLSFDDLKERAGTIVSHDLLNSISGGTENACHDGGGRTYPPRPEVEVDNTATKKPIIRKIN